LGEIFLVIPDTILKDFRIKAYKKFEKKGALSKAAEEAFIQWLGEDSTLK
jgi:hypothetical protein